ncbi:MAG: hypothetical protein ACREQA_12400 [Candidatus Binatia bacterium]
MASERRKLLGKLLACGVFSLLLYTLMYVYENQILQWTSKGKWYFVLPVILAFVFSFFHGAFTGYFWEILGFKPRLPSQNKNKWNLPR